MTYTRLFTAAALCAALAVSACQKKEEAPAEPAAAPDAAAEAAPAAAAAAMPAAATNVPAECQAYLDAVEACAVKAQATSAEAAAAIRQGGEATRASWAQVPDQGALAAACTAANDQMKAQNAAMGC